MYHISKVKATVMISSAITARASVSEVFLERAVPNFSLFEQVKRVHVQTAIDAKQWIRETAIGVCC